MSSAQKWGHGNGITTNGNSLFIAAGGNGTTEESTHGLIKVSKSGNITGTYDGTFTFQSIAYVGSNHFIVKPSDGLNNDEYLQYRHISLSGNNYIQTAGNDDFICHNPKRDKGYTIRQDIDYKSGKLYIILHNDEHEYPTTKADVSGNCNIILVYNLAGEYGYYGNLKCFEPIEMFVTKKKNMNSYEIEGMAFPESLLNPEFPFYISTNADTDAIYEVTNP